MVKFYYGDGIPLYSIMIRNSIISVTNFWIRPMTCRCVVFMQEIKSKFGTNMAVIHYVRHVVSTAINLKAFFCLKTSTKLSVGGNSLNSI